MEKNYKNIAYFFIGIIVVVVIGFYKTYFSLFPTFEGLKNIHHFHAISIILWLFLSVIQPIFIRQKQYKWHRVIGKSSYLLVPIIFFLMLVVYKIQYLKAEANGNPHAQNLIILYIPFTDAIPFLIYYVLAMVHRKNIAKHLRYMLATTVIVAGPALVRIFFQRFGFEFINSLAAASVVTILVFIGFIFYDKRNGKSLKNNAFTRILIIYLIPNTLIFFIPQSTWGQALAEWFAGLL